MVNDELTHKIIGCAMQVHTSLGSGFQEVTYQNSLEIEMQYQGLSLQEKKKCRSIIGKDKLVYAA